MRRFQEKSPKHLLNKKETGPNMDSFSLCERREAVEISNQEMCDIAISVIGEYVNERLYASDYIHQMNYEDSKKHFDFLSYAKWAADEIMWRLNAEAERLPSHITGIWREPIPPIDILAGFIDEMDVYICDGCKEQRKHIFSIAKEVAEDIILLFL